MGIFNRYIQESEKQQEHAVIDESIMQKRQKRLYEQINELQNRVNELQIENRYQQQYIEKLKYSLEGMTVAHSMDEIIDHYKNEAATENKSVNPFAGLIGRLPKSDATGGDNNNSDDDDIFNKIITDYKPAENLLKNKSDGKHSGNQNDSQNGRD